MQLSIVFATYSGGTQSAAETLSQKLTALGHETKLMDIKDASPEELGKADITVIASPTWDFDGKEGMPHEDIVRFFEAHTDMDLNGKRFAVMALGDSSYAHFCGSADHIETYLNNLHATIVIPALKIDGYFFNQETNNRSIADWAEQLVAQ